MIQPFIPDSLIQAALDAEEQNAAMSNDGIRPATRPINYDKWSAPTVMPPRTHKQQLREQLVSHVPRAQDYAADVWWRRLGFAACCVSVFATCYTIRSWWRWVSRR